MQFRLLGPLEASTTRPLLALGGRKQRSVLAVLLLHANDVVATERLSTSCGRRAARHGRPRASRSTSRGCASSSGDGRLVTRAPGYALQVDADQFDLAASSGSLAEGRPTPTRPPAAARLREALALWRGPPLADLAYEPFAQAEIARLEELRLAALEQRIEADLALGRHAQLVGELEALVAEHPLRERLRGAAACSPCTAPAARPRRSRPTGARGDAGRGARDRAGPRLRDLHEAILAPGRQSSTLAAPPPRRPAAPSRRARVRRPRPRARGLVGALGDAFAGRGRPCSSRASRGSARAGSPTSSPPTPGPAARGSSSAAAGRRAAPPPTGRGCRRCALSARVRCRHAGSPRRLRGRRPRAARPRAGRADTGVATTVHARAGGARFRLFDAAAEFLRNAAAERPLVLVIDDLQAADPPSLLLLRFVARRSRPPVC